MNDFWSFNVSSGFWTWIGGSFDTGQPSVYTGDNAWPVNRYGASMWVTKSGYIYLFGGAASTGTLSSAIFFIFFLIVSLVLFFVI